MEKTVTVDWIGFTDTLNNKHNFVPPDFAQREQFIRATPRFGYRQAVKYPSGLTIHYDGASDTMGAHYVYSGETLNELNREGVDSNWVLAWHTARGHRCTRLDLAIDVRGSDCLMQNCIDAAFAGKTSGTARSVNIIQNTRDGGATIYVGSRSSQKFVRIYNKAAQMGQTGDWVRIEIETKGDTARGIAKALQSANFGDIGDIARSLITDMVNFKFKLWKEIMACGHIDLALAKERPRGTEKWLLEQVTKAIARYEIEHPEKRVLERINQIVEMIVEGVHTD